MIEFVHEFAKTGGRIMILSLEHAALKCNYLKKEIAALPTGHGIMIRNKYPAVYITDWPGRPEMKGKRIVSTKPEAGQFTELNNRRLKLSEELAEAEGYLQYHSTRRKAKEDLWMDRDFFDACVQFGDSNPKPKPEYAPKLGDIKFRSKSELNIAQLLTDMGYEFVYETEFEIVDGIIEYPDFAVWVPEIGRSFILEHFGLLDRREYKTDAGWKINHYVDFGLMPGRDIIFSYESDKLALDIDLIKEQINALIMVNSTPAK